MNRGPVQGWTEVPDVPFAGERPKLTIGRGTPPAATVRWWAAVSSMPHCVLWGPSDWTFAMDTARLHAAMVRGEFRYAAEVRAREKLMGTTVKARELLKIRYVDVEDAEPVSGEMTPAMSAEDQERWRRLIDE